jgi:hypothetical protein
MLIFSISYPDDIINFLTLLTSLKEGIGAENRPKDRVKTGLLQGKLYCL